MHPTPDLAGLRPGKHRLPCPQCDKEPRDDALAVEVRDDGSAVWWCWRCRFSGGTRGGRTLTAHAGSKPAAPSGQTQERERHQSALATCRAIWHQVQPLAGTLGEEYLHLRHCMLPPADGDLRFHAALYCPETKSELPALVARVTTVIGNRAIGLHRIWIRRGEAKAVKKMHLGASADPVCIRLWPDISVGSSLGIAEGVESALAAARRFTPMWSTIDAGQMARFPLVRGVDSLTIYADFDDVGMKSARAVWDRYMYARRNANFLRPRQPHDDPCDAIAWEDARQQL